MQRPICSKQSTCSDEASSNSYTTPPERLGHRSAPYITRQKFHCKSSVLDRVLCFRVPETNHARNLGTTARHMNRHCPFKSPYLFSHSYGKIALKHASGLQDLQNLLHGRVFGTPKLTATQKFGENGSRKVC
jgi:hypothetical protein